jgi:phosphate/sulfate permease
MMAVYSTTAIILSIFYGIVIGQNDAANSFGPWIGAKVGKIRTGLVLCALCAFMGALLEGGKVIKTIGGGIVPSIYLSYEIAVIGVVAAIIWVFVASLFGLPISTTHSAVGGIGGIGAALILFGIMPSKDFNLAVIRNIAICWVCTPLGSALIASAATMVVLRFLKFLNIEWGANLTLKILLTLSSGYVAYTWGANDVANSVALIAGCKVMSAKSACILGGASIGLGAALLGKRVAETVGFGVTNLTPLMGIIANIATALTIHLFTSYRIPVSTTHALVGAVFGVGIARGVNMVNFKIVAEIFFAWVVTPVLTFLLTFVIYIAHHYITLALS